RSPGERCARDAEAAAGLLRRGAGLDGYAREIVRLYGPGEPGWVGQRLARLPEAIARAAVRLILGSGMMRRRLVFGTVFGMREEAP
ncbi:MAG: hypothetical protein AAB335_02460, partial [candidate division NC10 bacterium]